MGIFPRFSVAGANANTAKCRSKSEQKAGQLLPVWRKLRNYVVGSGGSNAMPVVADINGRCSNIYNPRGTSMVSTRVSNSHSKFDDIHTNLLTELRQGKLDCLNNTATVEQAIELPIQ